MDDTEMQIAAYLEHRGFTDVVYEPDGNVPPDFLVDGRIAVEVRRLNLNSVKGTEHQGLEEVSIPLWKMFKEVAAAFGQQTAGISWIISFHFRRPLPVWKKVKKQIRDALTEFISTPQASVQIGDWCDVGFRRWDAPHTSLFIVGIGTDRQSWGWQTPMLEENLMTCIVEKSKKIESHRTKYKEWWLALVDQIGCVGSGFDTKKFREQIPGMHRWDKVILVDPTDQTRSLEF